MGGTGRRGRLLLDRLVIILPWLISVDESCFAREMKGGDRDGGKKAKVPSHRFNQPSRSSLRSPPTSLAHRSR